VDVAKRGGVQDAGLLGLHAHRDGMVAVYWSLVRPVYRFAVGGELKIPYLISEFVTVRFEKKLDPPDVVFGRVRMNHFLAEGHLDFKELIRLDLVPALDDRDMLLRFPVGTLKQFSYLGHDRSSIENFCAYHSRCPAWGKFARNTHKSVIGCILAPESLHAKKNWPPYPFAPFIILPPPSLLAPVPSKS
jgi:hypothetical protein